MSLEASGTLTLAATALFDALVVDGAGGALRLLRIARERLRLVADPADLDAMEAAGAVRVAAERLVGLAAAGNAVASDALLRLHALHAGLARVTPP